MKFFENRDLLALIFLITPLFISGLYAYLFTIRKYGSIINKPPWKKTVGAIIGITFYGIIILFFGYDYFLQKKYGLITVIVLSLILAIVAIFLSKFTPRVNELIEEATRIKTKQEKEEAKKRKQKKKAQRKLKKTKNTASQQKPTYNPSQQTKSAQNASQPKKKAKLPSHETTVNYIGVVLTTFSQAVFTLFIICSIILRAVLLKDPQLNPESINSTLRYWETIAIGASIISIAIYFHTIYVSLASPKQMPNDTELNNIKERLTD